MPRIPPPNVKFITELNPSLLKVNTDKKYECNGYTYDYINYGTSFNGVAAQFPIYLPTSTGMKEWTSDSGSKSYTLLIQFPHINSKKLSESGNIERVDDDKVTTQSFIHSNGTVERRMATDDEIQQEIKIISFYVEAEKLIKKQAGITDNPRFVWNGAVQIRNLPDPKDSNSVLEGEFYPVCLRFKVNPKIKNINQFSCQNDAFEEIDENNQTIKMIKKKVEWYNVVKGCAITPIHEFGRIFRITKKGKVECGWHLFLNRLRFLPCSIEDEEDEENELGDDLEMPKI